MPITAMILRIVVIDPANGEAGVAEDRKHTRYELDDTDARNKLAAKLALAALDNLNTRD